ncbi:MAG: hypothetical protein ACMUJM_12005 [bacterium]
MDIVRTQEQRGVVLIFTVTCIILFITLTVMTFFMLHKNRLLLEERKRIELQAFYLAEKGLNHGKKFMYNKLDNRGEFLSKGAWPIELFECTNDPYYFDPPIDANYSYGYHFTFPEDKDAGEWESYINGNIIITIIGECKIEGTIPGYVGPHNEIRKKISQQYESRPFYTTTLKKRNNAFFNISELIYKPNPEGFLTGGFTTYDDTSFHFKGIKETSRKINPFKENSMFTYWVVGDQKSELDINRAPRIDSNPAKTDPMPQFSPESNSNYLLKRSSNSYNFTKNNDFTLLKSKIYTLPADKNGPTRYYFNNFTMIKGSTLIIEDPETIIYVEKKVSIQANCKIAPRGSALLDSIPPDSLNEHLKAPLTFAKHNSNKFWIEIKEVPFNPFDPSYNTPNVIIESGSIIGANIYAPGGYIKIGSDPAYFPGMGEMTWDPTFISSGEIHARTLELRTTSQTYSKWPSPLPEDPRKGNYYFYHYYGTHYDKFSVSELRIKRVRGSWKERNPWEDEIN